MSIHALSWVLRHSEARVGARLVLISLADHAHEDGSKSFPSIETLMEHTLLGRTAVKDALRRLRDDGMIVETGATRTGTVVYRIVMGGSESGPPRSESGLQGGRNPASRGSDSDPDPSVTVKDPSEKNGARGDLLSPAEEPEGFAEWLGHHALLTGGSVPRAVTLRRTTLAKAFAEIQAQGAALDDFKLESEGVWASPHMREGGHTEPENVLRKTRFGKYAAAGQRARSSPPETERLSQYEGLVSN